MKYCDARLIIILSGLIAFCVNAQTVGGACDGSAIISVGEGHFLNATDEDNIIRLYRLSSPAKPLRAFDLNALLKTERKKNVPKEADLEAVTRFGNRLYWIGSHGRDKKGNAEPSRQRLVATTISGSGAGTRITAVGSSFNALIPSLLTGNSNVASALKTAEPLPHQKDGIDIEGLAATGDGALLIGFRSPLVDGKALLVQLTNPLEVTSGANQPKFADPLLLDLGGLGIRDIIPAGKANQFLILAGETGVGPRSALFSWTLGEAPKTLTVTLPNSSGAPEGLLREASGTLFVSTDDGEQGTPACKDRPVNERTFTIQKLTPLEQ
jgi:hypothetical protein